MSFARALSQTRGGRCFHGTRDSSAVRRSLEALLSDKDVDCRRAARLSLGIADTENVVDVSLLYARSVADAEMSHQGRPNLPCGANDVIEVQLYAVHNYSSRFVFSRLSPGATSHPLGGRLCGRFLSHRFCNDLLFL